MDNRQPAGRPLRDALTFVFAGAGTRVDRQYYQPVIVDDCFSMPFLPSAQFPQPQHPSQARMALPALNVLTPRVVASAPLAAAMMAESPAMSSATAVSKTAPSPSKKRVRALPNASKSITLDLLRPHFEKPLAEVAGLFGICMTLMKKICRKNGVPRWPHRQIRGLRKSIWSIEKALRCCESETQRRSYMDHLQKQRAKLLTILRGPESSPAGRAAFEQVLAEPCSPLSDASASPVSSLASRPLLSNPSPVSARFPSPMASMGYCYQQLPSLAMRTHSYQHHQYKQQPHPAGTMVLSKPQPSPMSGYTPTAARLPSIASLLVANGATASSAARQFHF